MTLVAFVREAARRLAEGAAVDDVRAPLLTMRQHLGGLCAAFEPPAPHGVEVVRDLLLESFGLFDGVLHRLQLHIDGLGENDLAALVAEAEEADDILSAVEYVVEQNQQWLSQFSVG